MLNGIAKIAKVAQKASTDCEEANEQEVQQSCLNKGDNSMSQIID
jgi:hypothetical protein